jgi:phosphonate transport system substrate-binding protein
MHTSKHFLLLLSILLVFSRPLAADDKVYTFAVIPQQGLSELAEAWLPFVDWLSKASGVKLRFISAPDIPSFEQKLSQGAYDIAYMNPYHYVVFHDTSGYQALAKEKGRKLQGIIVVHKDSDLKDIHALNSATCVFPAPAAFAASMVPRAALRQQGINITPKFVASHDSVYLNVAKRKYVAGGGVNRTYSMLDESVRSQLRVLWTTTEYTPHAIATHPKLPAKAAVALQHAMTRIGTDVQGQQLLKRIGLIDIESAQDSDWNDIRALNINTEDSGIQ